MICGGPARTCSASGAVYDPLPLGLTPAEGLLGLAIMAVLIDRLGAGQPAAAGGPLTLPLLLVVLAVIAGAVTGASRASRQDLIFAARQLAWLPIVPLLVVNVVETERDARGALAFAGALAILKAVLGLAGVAAGVGIVVEGATITYYQPTANWLVLLAILGIAAAVLLRARPPRGLLAARRCWCCRSRSPSGARSGSARRWPSCS